MYDDSQTFVLTVKLMKSKSCYFQSGNFSWAHGLWFCLINRHAYNLSLITHNPETSSPRRCKSFLTVFIFYYYNFLYLPFGLTSRREQTAGLIAGLWKLKKTATRLVSDEKMWQGGVEKIFKILECKRSMRWNRKYSLIVMVYISYW